jgi:imidazolonepropionase-like amidohydrolase
VGSIAPAEMAAWPEMKWVSATQVAQWTAWKEKFLAAGTSTEASRARFLEVRRTLIKALHDGGVGMLLGADAPQMWNVPGFATHRELRAMVAAGLTPYQALAMGTRNVAQFTGTLSERGTIEAGKHADLVLVAGNPLEDIGNTARIEGVMRGSRWLGRADIDTRLAALAVR